MNVRNVDGNGSVEAERLRRLRLSEFLRDLVRQEGKMEAAELLGVNHKTLTRAEESGEITGRMGDALELLLRRADDAEVARLREAVGALVERVAALEGGMETPPAADVEGGGESSQVEGGDEDGTQAQAQGGKHEEGAGRSETRAAPPMAGVRSKKRAMLRRLDPEVVTEEPADDDDEVYGDAWPLVEEWRRLRAGHPHQGKSLSWLTTEERLLVLELAMLEEHGLTLPPETRPCGASDARARSTIAGRRWPTLGWRCGSGSCCAGCGRSSPCGCGGSRPRSRLRGRFSAVATSERSGR